MSFISSYFYIHFLTFYYVFVKVLVAELRNVMNLIRTRVWEIFENESRISVITLVLTICGNNDEESDAVETLTFSVNVHIHLHHFLVSLQSLLIFHSSYPLPKSPLACHLEWPLARQALVVEASSQPEIDGSEGKFSMLSSDAETDSKPIIISHLLLLTSLRFT